MLSIEYIRCIDRIKYKQQAVNRWFFVVVVVWHNAHGRILVELEHILIPFEQESFRMCRGWVGYYTHRALNMNNAMLFANK